jgi:hypothetical protein
MHGPRLCSAPPKGRCAASGAREQNPSSYFNPHSPRGFPFSRHIVPELCGSCRPQKCRGRREGRAPAGTRGPLCESCVTKAAQRHTGEAKRPAFPAQWFYGLCRDLPGERCTIAPVALQMADVADPVGPSHHHKIWRTDPGRQDHTILPYAGCTGRVRADRCSRSDPPCNHPRADAARVHHVPSRVRDDRDPPLGRVGIALYTIIRNTDKEKYFDAIALTLRWGVLPAGRRKRLWVAYIFAATAPCTGLPSAPK